jgi:hypothetical protein
MVLCRYNGSNESPRDELRASKVIADSVVVEQRRVRFNRRPDVGPGPWNCPMVEGDVMWIASSRLPGPTSCCPRASAGAGPSATASRQPSRTSRTDDHFDTDLLNLVGG